MKGSGELGAAAVIDGKGIGAIAKLSVADHQALVELLMLNFDASAGVRASLETSTPAQLKPSLTT